MSNEGVEGFHLVKVLLIGDTGVGKTSLMLRYVDDQFDTNFISTIGIDFRSKSLLVSDRVVKVQIWDTAGQERFNTITTSYYRQAHGALVVYDVNNRKTFDKVRAHIENCHRHAPEHLKIVLVGDKAESLSSEEKEEEGSHSVDVDKREVSYEEGAALAKELGVPFVETSAKYNINVDLAFSTLLDLVDPLHNPSLCLACTSQDKERGRPGSQRGERAKSIRLSARESQSANERETSSCCGSVFRRDTLQEPLLAHTYSERTAEETKMTHSPLASPASSSSHTSSAIPLSSQSVQFAPKTPQEVEAWHARVSSLMAMLYNTHTLDTPSSSSSALSSVSGLSASISVDEREREVAESESERLSNILVENALFRVPLFVLLLPECAEAGEKASSDGHTEEEYGHPWAFERTRYRLFFVCAHTWQVTLCGQAARPTERERQRSLSLEEEHPLDRRGFPVTLTHEFIHRVYPYLKTALVLARLGLEFSRLPLPHPALERERETVVHLRFLDETLRWLTSIERDYNREKETTDKSRSSLPSPLQAVEEFRHLSSAVHRSAQEALMDLYEQLDTSPLASLSLSFSHSGLHRTVSRAGNIQWVWALPEVERSFVLAPTLPSCDAFNAVIAAHAEHHRAVRSHREKARTRTCCWKLCSCFCASD